MIGFYFDEHMPKNVAKALMKKGYTVVRAVEVGMEGADDDSGNLPYATQHHLILVTFDHPFAGRATQRSDFYALVCLPYKVQEDVGEIIRLLQEFAELFDSEKDTAKVHWL